MKFSYYNNIYASLYFIKDQYILINNKLVIYIYNCLFIKTILFGKNSNI